MEKHKRQLHIDKIIKQGMPDFYYYLFETVEELRGLHPNVEEYSVKKMIKIAQKQERIRKRRFVEEHLLQQRMMNAINSDPKKKKAENEYKKILGEYLENGRPSN